jgi:hypothetical protein
MEATSTIKEVPGLIDPRVWYSADEARKRLRMSKSQWRRLRRRMPTFQRGQQHYVRGRDVVETLAARPSKRPKPTPQQKQPRGIEKLSDLDDVQREAAGYGIEIVVKTFKSGRSEGLHLMLNYGKRRLIHWWPSTNRVRIGNTPGRNAQAETLGEALDLAVRVLEKDIRQEADRLYPVTKSDVMEGTDDERQLDDPPF